MLLERPQSDPSLKVNPSRGLRNGTRLIALHIYEQRLKLGIALNTISNEWFQSRIPERQAE